MRFNYICVFLFIVLATNVFAGLLSDCWNGDCFKPKLRIPVGMGVVPRLAHIATVNDYRTYTPLKPAPETLLTSDKASPHVQSFDIKEFPLHTTAKQPETLSTVHTTHAPSSSPTSKPMPFEEECNDIMSILPIPSEIEFPKDEIKAICTSRFDELHVMHKVHQKFITAGSFNIYGRDRNFKSSTNSHLIVLDLDETIMDQRTFIVSERTFRNRNVSYWRSKNEDELVINFNQYLVRVNRQSSTVHGIQSEVWVGIFRKSFMKFLAFMQTHSTKKYDVILYSLAVSPLLIYHAVTMEMYYNYVYAAKHQLLKFSFKAVIARHDNINFRNRGNYKSLKTLMNILGNNGGLLNMYKSVVIMDDMEDKVWSNEIPQEMIDYGMNIVCFTPFAFGFIFGEADERLKLDDIAYEQIQTIRAHDSTFVDMMGILGDLPQTQKYNALFWLRLHSYQPMESASTESAESYETYHAMQYQF